MTLANARLDDRDAEVVAFQLRRLPRSPWSVASRCGRGYPSTISSPPVLEDGDRFPTMYWLTCPYLTRAVGALESSGMTDEWTRRIREDAGPLRDELLGVERRLREARAVAAGGADPCEGTGIAGQRDSLAVKCLHAHVALALAGLGDPIGEAIAGEAGECLDEECGRWATRLTETAE